MGWKGTLRSISAASRRSAREARVRESASHRAQSKIDKNVGQVVAKAASFEKKIVVDPIKALGLHYEEGSGFTSTPFEFSTEIFNGSVSLTSKPSDSSSAFSPPHFSSERFAVTPLSILFTRWGAVVAIRIENFDSDYRIRTPWHKRADPQGSSIYLLDTESSSYYYPLSSTLSGEVVAGHPKVALIAFEPFRQLTGNLRVFVSDVKLSRERGAKYSFEFHYVSAELRTTIGRTLAQPSLVAELQATLAPQVQQLRNQVSSSSCLVMGIVLIGSLFAIMSFAWRLLT